MKIEIKSKDITSSELVSLLAETPEHFQRVLDGSEQSIFEVHIKIKQSKNQKTKGNGGRKD